MQNYIINLNIFSVFTFILIVSANFLAEIFPCRVQYMLRHNMYIKHLFGILTMVFFVVLSIDKNKSIFDIGLNSFLLYILFILISKTHWYTFFIIVFILSIAFFINIEKDRSKQLLNDGDEKTNKIINERIKNYDYQTIIIYILTIFITIIGVLLYMGEKKLEYKNKFDYIIFFMGKDICKEKTSYFSLQKSLSAAFN